MCREVSGAFSKTLAASLSFAQSKVLGRSLVPRLTQSLFWHCLELRKVRPYQSQATTIGNHTQSFAMLVLFAFSELLDPWEYFLGSAKAEIRIWKFLTTLCTNHIGVISKYQQLRGSLRVINKHVMNNFYLRRPSLYVSFST